MCYVCIDSYATCKCLLVEKDKPSEINIVILFILSYSLVVLYHEQIRVDDCVKINFRVLFWKAMSIFYTRDVHDAYRCYNYIALFLSFAAHQWVTSRREPVLYKQKHFVDYISHFDYER